MALNKALLSKTLQCFSIKLFIEDCLMLLNKAIYRRLSNGFEQSCLLGDV